MKARAVRPRLVVMAKRAEAGRVKTRLARGLGTGRATAFYRQQLDRTLRTLRDDRRWQTILAVAPDGALADAVWPSGTARMGQGTGDLGARMIHVFVNTPPGPVVIIGSDIPGIARRDIAAAFAALAGHDAVIGPADDGGYWLIGLARTRPVSGLFDRVRWSTEHAAADTLANLKRRSVARLRTLADIDTAADYRAWHRGQ